MIRSHWWYFTNLLPVGRKWSRRKVDPGSRLLPCRMLSPSAAVPRLPQDSGFPGCLSAEETRTKEIHVLGDFYCVLWYRVCCIDRISLKKKRLICSAFRWKILFGNMVRKILLLIKDIWSVQSVIKRGNNKTWNHFNSYNACICTCTAHPLSSVQCVSLLYLPATTTQIWLNTTLFRNIHHVNIVQTKTIKLLKLHFDI